MKTNSPIKRQVVQNNLFESVLGEAVFEGDYRYALKRIWDPGKDQMAWVMLNPSTATEEVFDPTVRRCNNWARKWGYGGFHVLNIFALRSTDPQALATHPDPVGPENNQYIRETVTDPKVKLVMAAWGVWGEFMSRGAEVAALVKDLGVGLYCLGKTNGGHPRHPLYVAGSQKPVLF
jgi:hypothetical protein